MRTFAGMLLGLLLCLPAPAADGMADLRAEVERLRLEISRSEESTRTPIGRVDQIAANHFGPGAPVSTKIGKLHISGLLQVWFQSVQNDNKGVEGNADFQFDADPEVESNEQNDNDTFRIRRAELRFSMDVHENISAYVMIDPSREASPSFYPLPTYQRHNRFLENDGVGEPGDDTRPRLLQDAFITFHGLVPHHEFYIGQFKPPAGEESWRASGSLDFVERSMVTGINNVRDLGVMVHGNWLDERVRYWAGVFNGPPDTVLSDPEVTEAGNRSDDNDAKDFAFRIAVRPVWAPEKWHGRLELGYHRTDGTHGESGDEFNDSDLAFDANGEIVGVIDRSINGIEVKQTSIRRQGAWAYYRPGGPVKGWWLRGEWGEGHDRYGRDGVTSLLGIGDGASISPDVRVRDPFLLNQRNPAPVTVGGWYFSTGYRLSESTFADSLAKGGALGRALGNMEFAFRYEVYQNIAMEDLVEPDRHTDQFKTQVWTAGMNYYIQKHNAKIQANYLFVDEPHSDAFLRGLREVRNNVFVLNFQIGF